MPGQTSTNSSQRKRVLRGVLKHISTFRICLQTSTQISCSSIDLLYSAKKSRDFGVSYDLWLNVTSKGY